MASKIVTKTIEQRISDQLNSVNPENVLRVDKNIFLGKEKLTEVDLREMKGDVIYLKKCRLWAVLMATLRSDAIERMAINSRDWNDVVSGKMTLYTLSIIQKTLDSIEKLPISTKA